MRVLKKIKTMYEAQKTGKIAIVERNRGWSERGCRQIFLSVMEIEVGRFFCRHMMNIACLAMSNSKCLSLLKHIWLY